jgi:hypothetical protein
VGSAVMCREGWGDCLGRVGIEIIVGLHGFSSNRWYTYSRYSALRSLLGKREGLVDRSQIRFFVRSLKSPRNSTFVHSPGKKE